MALDIDSDTQEAHMAKIDADSTGQHRTFVKIRKINTN